MTRLLIFLFAASILVPSQDFKPKFFAPDKAWVDKTLKSLNLRDKVAQLIKIRVPGRFLNRRSTEYLKLESEIRRNHVGGVILFAGNIYESAILLNDLQRLSHLPLLVAADFERGASFRIADTTSFPWTMAIGATGSEEFAYQQGAITAQEARAMGVHWVYAPVMDVNNNPDNPVINIRSFGEDPHLVARLGTAFIRGSRDNGVLSTAKHFPGHGDTATDSHIGLAVIPSDQSRLDSVELVPFRKAIEVGVDSIMTAHVAVPRVTGEPDIPATLSAKVLTDLLRNRLKFDGLVITDAMEMGGITTRYGTGKAAIRAVQAGADMLLLPPDTDAAIDEIVRAAGRGEISEKRIEQSVERILATKSRLRLNEGRTVPIEQIASIIAAPENQKLAQEIADRSMTLLKDERHLVPIDPARPRRIFSLVLSTDLDTSPGALFQTEMRRRFPSIETTSIDSRVPADLVEKTLKSAARADLIVVSTLVRVITGTGVGLPDKQRALVERLFQTGKPVIWVAFGNPYVLRSFPRAPTYLCTFSYSDVSYIAAARALSGEIPISGKMPVSIPGLAKVGNGLQVAALAAQKK